MRLHFTVGRVRHWPGFRRSNQPQGQATALKMIAGKLNQLVHSAAVINHRGRQLPHFESSHDTTKDTWQSGPD